MTTYQQQLMDAFNFTAADLDANRQGHVSEQQIKRVKNDQRRILVVSGVALSVIITVIAVIFAFDRAGDGPIVFDDLLAIIVPMGLVTVIALYILQNQQRDVINKLIYADVHALKGEISLSPRNSRAADHLTIGKTHFVLTPLQFKLMQDYVQSAEGKTRYHIYHVRRISRILSIEVIE